MKRLIALLVLLAGCGHGPVHNPVHYGHTGPVNYEAMVLIHKGLQQAAFHRRFILIEGQDSHDTAAPVHEQPVKGSTQP